MPVYLLPYPLSLTFLVPHFLCEKARNQLKQSLIGPLNSSILSWEQLTGCKCHGIFGIWASFRYLPDRQVPAMLAISAGHLVCTPPLFVIVLRPALDTTRNPPKLLQLKFCFMVSGAVTQRDLTLVQIRVLYSVYCRGVSVALFFLIVALYLLARQQEYFIIF